MKSKIYKTIKLYLKYILQIELLIIILLCVVILTKNYETLGVHKHNIDLSYNVALISNDFNNYFNGSYIIDYRKLKDKTASGEVLSYVEGYRHSIGEISYLSMHIMYASIVLGAALVCSYFIKWDF